MKKFILFFIGCLFCSIASAQYNYYKFNVGAGAGLTTAFADLQKKLPKPVFLGTVDYSITPFFSAGIEFQKGTLSGGGVNDDPHHRFFVNSYSAMIVGAKVQLGQFVDFEQSNLLYALRGFYIGTGIGRLNNNLTELAKDRPDPGNPGVPYKFFILEKSQEWFIPINTGISFNIVDQFRYTKYILSANYGLNASFGEGLDGYKDPKSRFKNNGHDFYGTLTFGFKYSFGSVGLY